MMVDFKFDALYRKGFIESLQKSGNRKAYRKIVLVGGAVSANLIERVLLHSLIT